MREIKFRACDKKYKKMIFEGFHLMGEVMSFNQIEQYLFGTKDTDGIPTLERWNDIETMQFTGLKDKNKKEIYEGDIVIWHVNNLNSIGIVEYIDNYGGHDLKHTYDEYHVCCDWLRGEYEVIGNIYENPELL